MENEINIWPWKKFDTWKSRVDLIPSNVILWIWDVLWYWAEKYDENNWQNVKPFKQRYYAAALRHLLAYNNWELIDKESWLPHLYHAMTNLTFLAWWEENL